MTMRLASKARDKAALPVGYQFGDAGDGARVILLEADEFIVGTLPKGTTVHRQPPRPQFDTSMFMTGRTEPGWNGTDYPKARIQGKRD